MRFETPTKTVLYSIEQAIKEYRKFCQRNIDTLASDITIDQCLVLIILDENEFVSQNEIAELIFKDNASITRMIELMVTKDYLKRSLNTNDRRKFQLEITAKGRKTIKKLSPVIKKNREIALGGLSESQLKQLYSSLQKIITNCSNK